MPDESNLKTEPASSNSSTGASEPDKNNDAMINYLSKEIETMSNNIMTSRNRISFSLWVGPFLFLASVIVGSKKEGFEFQTPCLLAWILLGVAALLFFVGIAIIIGEIERGAWIQCNEWRRCIIKLQLGHKITPAHFRELVLYRQLENKVWRAYVAVFTICLLMFAAVIYFLSELLKFSSTALPVLPPVG